MMTIELNKKEIKAICFAYAKLSYLHLFDTEMEDKPKQLLQEAVSNLEAIIDKIGKMKAKDKKSQLQRRNEEED